MFRRAVRSEVLIIVILAVATSWFSYTTLQRQGLGNFYQMFFDPAVSIACGGDFTEISGASPDFAKLRNFLDQKTDRFSCDDLPPGPRGRTPLNSFQMQTMYLIGAAGLVWSVTGVKWAALISIAVVLSTISALAIYGFSRLFLPWWWSAGVVVMSTIAVSNVSMIGHIRDFSKAPFIIGFLFFCGLALLRADRARSCLIFVTMAGFSAGLGFGFRTDSLMTVPFFGLVLVILAIARPEKKALLVVSSSVLFALSFLIASLPVALTYRSGGQIGHVALLGLMTPFNQNLGLYDPSYDIGHMYLDHYISGYVNALDMMLGSSSAPGSLDGSNLYSRYGAVSVDALVRFAKNFPSDIIIRSYASISHILDRSFESPVAHGVWHISNLPILCFFLSIAILAARSLTSSVFLIFTVLYFAGFCALQFALRHAFYLEFLSWVSCFIVADWLCRTVAAAGTSAVSAPAMSHRIRFATFAVTPIGSTVLRFVSLPAAVIVVGLAALWGARWYQQQHVAGLFEKYLAADRVPVALTETKIGDRTLLRPEASFPNLAGGKMALTDNHFNASYLVATTDASRCPDIVPELTVQYDSMGGYDPSRKLLLTSNPNGNDIEQFFIPVISCANTNLCGLVRFEGLSMKSSDRACLTKVEAISNTKALPLPLWIRFKSDWQDRNFYQEAIVSPPTSNPALDRRRRSDIKLLGEALEAYARSNSGSYLVSGSGSAGAGVGYASLSYGGVPSVVAALVAKGFLTKNLVDPINPTGYMIYLCDQNKRFAIWAALDTPSPEDETAARSKCNASGANGAMDRYGKNFAVGN